MWPQQLEAYVTTTILLNLDSHRQTWIKRKGAVVRVFSAFIISICFHNTESDVTDSKINLGND